MRSNPFQNITFASFKPDSYSASPAIAAYTVSRTITTHIFTDDSHIHRCLSSTSQHLFPTAGIFMPMHALPKNKLPELKAFLDPVAESVETPDYIASDPVAFMYLFDNIEDRNLIGFISALMAWGRRDIVMAKITDLLGRFDAPPSEFIGNYSKKDAGRLSDFRHRTFTAEDMHWILCALSGILNTFAGFEAFWSDCYRISRCTNISKSRTGKPDLAGSDLFSVFHQRFFEFIPGAPERVRKHLARPEKKSSCKRLWFYLRWTLRKKSPVDPGTMSFMSPKELMIPLDVHVARYARMFGLLTRKANDWTAVCELTDILKEMDPEDPVRYDYALFGLGIGKWNIPGSLILNPRECGLKP